MLLVLLEWLAAGKFHPDLTNTAGPEKKECFAGV